MFKPNAPSHTQTLYALQPRTQNILWSLLALCLFGLTAWYQVALRVWFVPLNEWVQFGYHLAAGAAFGISYDLISRYFENVKQSPIRVLWSLFLVVLGVFAVCSAWSLVYVKGDLFFVHRLSDETITGALTHTGLAMLQGLCGVFLLVQLKDLVLFKRTPASVRNWQSMLASFAGTYFTLVISRLLQVPFLDIFAILVTGVFIILNAFRLSWVAYLSFRDKLVGSAFTLLVLFTLLVAFTEVLPHRFFSFLIRKADPFVFQYSLPLTFTLALTLIFGILYTMTAFLSLIFHLPTTVDFERKTGDLATLNALTKLGSQVFDQANLNDLILQSVLSNKRYESAWLALTDPKSGTLRPNIAATSGITAAQIAAWIDEDAFYAELQTRREPLVLGHAVSDHRLRTPNYEIGSLAMLPLVARNETLGALFITQALSDGFEDDDIRSMGTFADQVALALDNARFLEERIEKERLGRELAIAREVQKRLLPQSVPQIHGASLQASYEFAYEVGGDYFDFVSLDTHQHSLIIGDVSGKGTSAAFYMAAMKGIYQALARSHHHPVALLIRANEAILAQKEKNIFITATAAFVDTQTEQIILARAGHAPALHINLHGEVQYLRKGGLGLGLAKGDLFARTLIPETLRLQPGDVFVLYTDGLIENRSATGESYGYERLVEALKTHRHEDAAAIHAAILADLNHFTEGVRYFDDMTLIVFKWHGHRVASLVSGDPL